MFNRRQRILLLLLNSTPHFRHLNLPQNFIFDLLLALLIFLDLFLFHFLFFAFFLEHGFYEGGVTVPVKFLHDLLLF